MSDTTGVVVAAEDFRKIRGRVVLDYTSRDFAAIRAQLVGLAKGFMPDWETVGEAGDFGTLILELFAYMGDIMHFYIDRTASEGFLGTAVRKQSVLYIADMLGYKPIGQQAASVTLNFGLDVNAGQVADPGGTQAQWNAYKVVLPAGTRITDNGNNMAQQIIFELDAPVTLKSGATKVEAVATEGITVRQQEIGTSKGVPNATYLIPDRGVIYGTVDVTTREGGEVIEWTHVSDLALARPTQAAFTTYVDDENRTFVVFGDNASGRLPPYGAEIFCTYRYGVGAIANSLAEGELNVIIPPTNVETWGVSVVNTISPLGGSDSETAESMRYSVPRAAGRLKNRAVTLNDYADLALQVPGVAKAVAYGTLYTSVYVRIAPLNGVGTQAYMARLIASVENHLSDKILVGTRVSAEPADVNSLWHRSYVRLIVHVQPAYNRGQVRINVEDNVRSLFFFDKAAFGGKVTIGQVYRAALSVQGVEWVDLTWLDINPPADETDTYGDDDFQTVKDIVPNDIHIVKVGYGRRGYSRSINSKQILSNEAVLGTTVAHGFRVDDSVTVTGVDATFNGTFTVTGIPDTTHFKYAKPATVNQGPSAATGTVTTPALDSFVEPEADWPDLSEEERTHDGIWVIAVAGLVNT